MKKILITDGERFEDLGFDDAVKYFECTPEASKHSITKEFYNLLEFNKKQFIQPEEDEEIQTIKRGGASNHKEVKLRIEYAIKEGRLTDTQESLKTYNYSRFKKYFDLIDFNDTYVYRQLKYIENVINNMIPMSL